MGRGLRGWREWEGGGLGEETIGKIGRSTRRGGERNEKVGRGMGG